MISAFCAALQRRRRRVPVKNLHATETVLINRQLLGKPSPLPCSIRGSLTPSPSARARCCNILLLNSWLLFTWRRATTTPTTRLQRFRHDLAFQRLEPLPLLPGAWYLFSVHSAGSGHWVCFVRHPLIIAPKRHSAAGALHRAITRQGRFPSQITQWLVQQVHLPNLRYQFLCWLWCLWVFGRRRACLCFPSWLEKRGEAQPVGEADRPHIHRPSS
jgi:hypothetical protein